MRYLSPRKRKERNGVEAVSQEIITKNFPELTKGIKARFKNAPSSKQNVQKKSFPKHIRVDN